MFVRKKRNKSGTISVQIVDKSNGYRVLETIGYSKDKEELKGYIAKAEAKIGSNKGRQEDLYRAKPSAEIEEFVRSLRNGQIHTVGPELVLGALFDRIGFNSIKDELFRHLVLARLAYPSSKLKTVDYLYRYKGIVIEVDAIYRFLDKLQSKYKEAVEKIAYEYTKHLLKEITVVFYDMTTLYFEAEDEDDLRKIGFSKDGKFRNPQIMLGLLVGSGGYPIGYDIFEGNVFEGKTLLPTLEKIKKKFDLGSPVVVADAAMLSKENVNDLKANGYQFILGGRIKNENDETKRTILENASRIKNNETASFNKSAGERLIVSYSETRDKKDAYNRERGLRLLRQKVRTGRLSKKNINNRGYNKFLTLKGTLEIEIDEQKVKNDSLWDGLKGYVTNTALSDQEVIENYRHLWQIEKAFRISKTDLRIRPVHHYRRKRIEAHICVAFVAYTIYKELERLLYKHNVGLSVKKSMELTHTMYELECLIPNTVENQKFILKMDLEQQILYDIVKKESLG